MNYIVKIDTITFNHTYNKLIDSNLISNYKKIIFGHKFNRPINKLPNSLIHITFGNNFNKPVDILPEQLIQLTFFVSLLFLVDVPLNFSLFLIVFLIVCSMIIRSQN